MRGRSASSPGRSCGSRRSRTRRRWPSYWSGSSGGCCEGRSRGEKGTPGPWFALVWTLHPALRTPDEPGAAMSIDTDRIIVTTGETAGGGVRVNHREFPEIHGEGADEAEAATHLANQMTRALDSALTNWRR